MNEINENNVKILSSRVAELSKEVKALSKRLSQTITEIEGMQKDIAELKKSSHIHKVTL